MTWTQYDVPGYDHNSLIWQYSAHTNCYYAIKPLFLIAQDKCQANSWQSKAQRLFAVLVVTAGQIKCQSSVFTSITYQSLKKTTLVAPFVSCARHFKLGSVHRTHTQIYTQTPLNICHDGEVHPQP